MERIITAAIRIDKCTVLAATQPDGAHARIVQSIVKLHDHILDPISETEYGFLTTNGRFVDRHEAGTIALAAGQIEHATPELCSSDVW